MLLLTLLTTVLIFTGCSKSTQTDNKPVAQPTSSPPVISAPPESAQSQTVPPAPVQAPKKQRPKTKPATKPPAAAAATKPPEEVSVPAAINPAPPVAQLAPVQPVPATRSVTLPAGTLVPVRTIESIDSRTDQT